MAKTGKWHAFVMLVVYEGILNFIIDFGINFAIAYGMYKGRSKPVTLWKFPHTFSGDCALSTFIQVVITWFVEELLVGWDFYNGKSCDLSFWKVPNRGRGWLWKYLEVENDPKHSSEYGKGSKDRLAKPKFKTFLKDLIINYPNRGILFNLIFFTFKKVLRAILLAIPIWIVIWPIMMGVMASIGTKAGGIEYTFGNYPTPQIAKGIYAGILGMTSTPIIMAFIILRYQWQKEYQLKEKLHPTSSQVEIGGSILINEDSTLSEESSTNELLNVKV